MWRELTEHQHAATGVLDDWDDGFEVLAPDYFRDLLGDEASRRKILKPLWGNGHTRLDPVSRYTLVELAWYYDPAKIEEITLWDAKALRKMRTPWSDSATTGLAQKLCTFCSKWRGFRKACCTMSENWSTEYEHGRIKLPYPAASFR